MAISAIVKGVTGVVSSQAAASAQKKAATLAQQTQQGFFNTAKSELQPFIDTGQTALPALSGLSGTGPEGSAGIMATLNNLPGYQFAKQQGLESTQNSFAARGLGTSGAAAKGAANYAVGLAQTDYSDYFNKLLQTAQLGSGAGQALAGQATAAGQGIASSQIGAGNAQAAGKIGAGNAVTGAINDISGYQALAAILGQQQGGFGGNSGGASASSPTG